MTAFAGTPTLPEDQLVLWRTLFPLFRALARFLAPWRLEGAERIPKRGGYILVSNHINWKDPPWIEFALGRAIRFMAKRELFQIPVIGFALRAIGAFPVRRGEADRAALQMALKVLEAGHPAGFFPEGHRSESGALIRGHPGIALIARRSNAVIVPIAVIGTPRARLGAFWRRDILLRVGEPFHAADLGVDMANAQGLTDAIMVRIAQMLPSEMRGAYSTRDSREPWSIRGQDDFVEVVAPTDFSSADRLFGEWLAERRLSRSDLRDDDIRIDIVRMQDGRSAKRYRVWKSFAPHERGSR
ncbi:MAG: 1-acyl-sn-glycerol-3-phosphate acyltransferase [Chloroflexi bacterium]|nr:MAG: 1-acyl-sn-glycerol-3-phosphate acyltransferase [Chloroflexota bacterium]